MSAPVIDYHLGAVKPWVKAAAEFLGPMFGITRIGGYRPTDKYPDHPGGYALDFMTGAGDALANYAVAHADDLGVDYVIWNRRIWTRARGWHPYTGENPHIDHVHLSFFEDKAGPQFSGLGPSLIAGGDGFDLSDLNPLKGVAEAITFAAKPYIFIGQTIANPIFWKRFSMGLLGAAFIVLGVWQFAKKPVYAKVKGVQDELKGLVGVAAQGAAFGAGAGAVGGKAATTLPGPRTGPSAPSAASRMPEFERPISAAPVSSGVPLAKGGRVHRFRKYDVSPRSPVQASATYARRGDYVRPDRSPAALPKALPNPAEVPSEFYFGRHQANPDKRGKKKGR